MQEAKNFYGLVVGISAYTFISPLPSTVLRDARDIYDILVNPQVCGYTPENVQLLLDAEATRANVRAALQVLASSTNDDSTVFIYISSHGAQLEQGQHQGAYLLPVDTLYASPDSLAETAVSGEEFTEALRRIPARKVVVLFDCCHAGGIGQPKQGKNLASMGLPEALYDALRSGRGRVIFASSDSDELSWIKPMAQNSLFTQHLLAGLSGGAVGAGGLIRIFDLFDYIQPRVTSDQPNQHPLFKAEVRDNFPIALFLGGKTLTPQQPPLPPDEYAYDVFVSYRQAEPDKDWVRKILVPQLESKGLRVCIDYRDFRLGAAVLDEMERAVLTSRYTLGVLSPAYLESGFTHLENLLAEHLGAENGQRRWIALLRQECQPRLRVRTRMWLDATKDEDWDSNLERLAYELRLPPT